MSQQVPFTVIVRLKPKAGLPANWKESFRASAPVMASLPGFVSSRLLHDAASDELVSVVQWKSRADHEACMLNPIWQEKGRQCNELFMSGKLETSITTYDLLHGEGAPV